MKSVLILGEKAATPIRLNLNGRALTIPYNVATPVPGDFLAVLAASDVSYEILDDVDLRAPEPTSAPPVLSPGSGEDGDGESQQGADTVAADPVLPDEAFLDRSVRDIIPDLADMTLPQLQGVRTAEERGKTRKSLITEIEALIATKSEG